MVGRLIHRALIAIALLALASPAWSARLVAATDRAQLAVTEHLSLTLSLYDSDTRLRAEGVAPNVDLTLLTPDFHVGSINGGFRYNAFRNRGRASSELIVELFPRRQGILTIPSFQIDDTTSSPIEIEVRAAADAAAPLVFSRSGITPDAPYEQQQVIAYVDMYYRVELESAKLGGDLETEPPALELLEHYRLPNSERQESVEGIQYNVLRSAWALFPKGTEPLRLYFPDVWVVTRQGEKRRLPHDIATIAPRDLPAAAQGLPVGEVTAEVTAPSATLAFGQAASWQIRLRGAVSSRALPQRLAIATSAGAAPFQDQAEITRQDSPTEVQHSATYTATVVGATAGPIDLAPLRFRFFNPRTGTVEQREQALGGVNVEVKSDTQTTNAAAPPVATTTQNGGLLWPALTAMFGGLWLATVVAALAMWVRLQRVESQNTPIQPTPRPSTRPLLDRLANLLHSQNLDEGIRTLERERGPQAELRTIVRDVQTYYFGAEKAGNETELLQRIEAWARSNPTQQTRTNGSDAWDPRNALEPRSRAKH